MHQKVLHLQIVITRRPNGDKLSCKNLHVLIIIIIIIIIINIANVAQITLTIVARTTGVQTIVMNGNRVNTSHMLVAW